jgi:ornithine--oxo-acid transaminase
MLIASVKKTGKFMSSPVVSHPDAVYENHVNPQWVKLLNILRLNVQYKKCEGIELHTADGRVILDFLSGYCVHNAGHNHPDIIQAVRDELDRRGPAMLQSHVPELAGELSARLCALAGAKTSKAFSCSSGSEDVEAAIKFARAHTGRSGLLYFDGAFHGLTCGALSMMGDNFWRDGFGPMLPDTAAVPFNNLEALQSQLKTRKFAALFIEPIQAEAGIQIPNPGYLAAAHQLCNKYGTLLVSDEVQTGMFRIGTFLAGQQHDLQPDMIVLAKAAAASSPSALSSCRTPSTTPSTPPSNAPSSTPPRSVKTASPCGSASPRSTSSKRNTSAPALRKAVSIFAANSPTPSPVLK